MTGSPSGGARPGPIPAPDEDALVEKARAGDEAAFGSLVAAYQDQVFGLALRMTRNREDADEAAQDAFVRAWRALPGFRGECRFSTWIHAIAARRALDKLAARKRRGEVEAPLEEDAGPGTGGASFEEDARARRIRALVAILPEEQQTVVTLFYFSERSVAEIAAALGSPEGTVKTHLHRARAALRKAWEREARQGGPFELR